MHTNRRIDQRTAGLNRAEVRDRQAVLGAQALGHERAMAGLRIALDAEEGGHRVARKLRYERTEVERVIEQAEAYKEIQKSRVEMMRAYAETRRCRRVLGGSCPPAASRAVSRASAGWASRKWNVVPPSISIGGRG